MAKYTQWAKSVRPVYQAGAQSLPDAQALRVRGIYEDWQDLCKLGKVEAAAGYKFTYGGDLYKCVHPNPEFKSEWIPGIDTAALYTRIDENHAGTREDPIPYDGNMILCAGLYYTQDGAVYRCTRDTVHAVFAPLNALVGLYVEVVADG